MPAMRIIRDLSTLTPGPYPVVALGNFDGVHIGHQAILRQAIERARAAGGTAWVITFDPLPAKFLAPDHAPALLTTFDDRLALLDECGLDGAVVLEFTRDLSRIEARGFVRDYILGRIGAREVVVGHSVSFGHRRAGNAGVMVELGREFGFDTTVVGPVKAAGVEVSSTKIREAVQAGDMELAAKLLGRWHFLSGRVVHGRERGRRIGVRTANLETATECIPPDGVYATRAVLPDGAFGSITNIGMRPTFGESSRSIEAHIFDFDRDLYGAQMKLELVGRIRGEVKFGSAQALADQIASDVRRAQELLAAI
jgi:riboflavin kinase/FMN adenylyltransferase